MPLSDQDLREKTQDQLLILAIEEASEVIHAACKAMRFGFGGFHPKDTKFEKSNGYALCVEAEQLGAICRILGAKLGFRYEDICQARRDAAVRQKEVFPNA